LIPSKAQNVSDEGVSTPNSLFVNPSGTGPRYGTLGRNVFRGPWFNGWDAAMMKNFKVTEAVKMQLRFEAINVDNHPGRAPLLRRRLTLARYHA
jgi:hypothetical protein